MKNWLIKKLKNRIGKLIELEAQWTNRGIEVSVVLDGTIIYSKTFLKNII